MSNDQVHYGCPECCSFSVKEDKESALSKVEEHNESRHDGEELAEIVDTDSEEYTNEFIEKAYELAPESRFKHLLRRAMRGNTPLLFTSDNHDENRSKLR